MSKEEAIALAATELLDVLEQHIRENGERSLAWCESEIKKLQTAFKALDA